MPLGQSGQGAPERTGRAVVFVVEMRAALQTSVLGCEVTGRDDLR